MIHELRISGLGVIAEAACPFAAGFTAVTGETGAGKTMVVSSLGLLAGRRPDPGLVRHGADRAAVEGVLDVPAGVGAAVTDAGGIVEDDTVTAARIVATRTRSVLGGRSVPSALLADVMAQLLAIHGQHDQSRLASRARDLLDAYAGAPVQQLAAEVRDRYAALREVVAELESLRTSAMQRARELDLLEYSLAEIERIDPQPGEDVALAREADRLENADVLASAVRTAHGAIAAQDDGMDAMGLLAAARRALSAAEQHDPELAGPVDLLRSAMAQLTEAAADLARYAQDVADDPMRLAAVQDRRADLARLSRKYGGSVEDVLDFAEQGALRLAELAGADDRIEALAGQVAAARTGLAGLCAELRAQRRAASGRFAAEVADELAALAMPGARVAFEVTTRPDPDGLVLPDADLDGPVAVGPAGVDEVVLMLAGHAGAPLRPLAQAASGGELSRVMLAVQVVLAGADPVPTMVFDEVDAGVGGAAAVEVGRRLQRLAGSTQVIVVTHLPQVAAFADRHLVVMRDSDGSVTESSVRAVDGEDRVRELARMLAGLAESQSAGEHARELLGMAARA